MENSNLMQANGKICHIDIPAVDIKISSSFYRVVFGWNISERGDGVLMFNDTSGEISGTWNLCTEINPQPGVLVYIMVDNIADTVEKIEDNGGKMSDGMTESGSAITARFTDPAGNVFGLYQVPAIM